MGKPLDPDYWKKYRASHPVYKQRQNKLHQNRRLLMSAEERRRDRGTTKIIVVEQQPIPSLHIGHDLFDHAKAIAAGLVSNDRRTVVYDPLYEDILSEIVVALLEGKSPLTAALNYKYKERAWSKNVLTGGDIYSLEKDY